MTTSKSSAPIQLGQVAPKFRLPASDGTSIALADFTRKRSVILCFYPKADTPGCTAQACGFRDDLAAFNRAGVAVLGISPDPIDTVVAFASKYKVNFPLLTDADHKVAQKYGVLGEKMLYGRKYWGVLRTTFIIDRGGKIAHVFERVKPQGHDREVIEWLGSRDKSKRTPRA